jgi:glutathionyl-hydroquinone reductase
MPILEQRDADQGCRLEHSNILSALYGSRARAALEGHDMGLLVDGYWTDRWHDTSASSGRFQRPESAFRNWVTPDGTPGPTGDGGFKAEPGRYHLYVSLACPWAHRTLIFRALKGFETAISLSIVHSFMGDHGWTFEEGPGVIPDPVAGADRLYQVPGLYSVEPDLYRSGDGTGALGQRTRRDRIK